MFASMAAVSAIGLGSIRDALFAVLGFGAAFVFLARARLTTPSRSYWEGSRWQAQPVLASVLMGVGMAALAELTLVAFGNPFRPAILNPLCAVALGLLLGAQLYRRLAHGR
jgi:hypothetical protein